MKTNLALGTKYDDKKRNTTIKTVFALKIKCETFFFSRLCFLENILHNGRNIYFTFIQFFVTKFLFYSIWFGEYYIRNKEEIIYVKINSIVISDNSGSC